MIGAGDETVRTGVDHGREILARGSHENPQVVAGAQMTVVDTQSKVVFAGHEKRGLGLEGMGMQEESGRGTIKAVPGHVDLAGGKVIVGHTATQLNRKSYGGDEVGTGIGGGRLVDDDFEMVAG